jgi:hypothetical protein
VSILQVRLSFLHREEVVVNLILIIGLVLVTFLKFAGGISKLLVQLVKKLV